MALVLEKGFKFFSVVTGALVLFLVHAVECNVYDHHIQ